MRAPRRGGTEPAGPPSAPEEAAAEPKPVPPPAPQPSRRCRGSSVNGSPLLPRSLLPLFDLAFTLSDSDEELAGAGADQHSGRRAKRGPEKRRPSAESSAHSRTKRRRGGPDLDACGPSSSPSPAPPSTASLRLSLPAALRAAAEAVSGKASAADWGGAGALPRLVWDGGATGGLLAPPPPATRVYARGGGDGARRLRPRRRA